MTEQVDDTAADGELTIDELAREAGMTVRNIRAHQSRGLLPPPEVRSRTGYYGREHLARLRVIRELQAEGFNLRAIQRLIESSDGAGEQVLDFGRALLSAFAEEEPEVSTGAELAAGLGGQLDERTLRKAIRLGIVRPLGEDRFEVTSPTLRRAGEELVAMGVPIARVLAIAEQTQRHSDAIAKAFVKLFLDEVGGGFSDPKRNTPEDWERMREALERLRPLATEAVRASFQQRMSRAVERELERTLRG
jgi:DNA-binding transcriptional MerR regulator